MTPRPRLVVMAKQPVAGRVKTRLAHSVGTTTATGFYRSTATAVLHRLGRDPRWQTEIAVDPDKAVRDRFWPASTGRSGQGRGDLGQRMADIFRHPAPGPIAIIGTDVPGIRAAHIAAAFAALGRNDVVFGPAEDGGYWLIALRRTPRIVARFDHIRWSTEFALADTVASFKECRVGFVDCLADVDDAGDWLRVRGWAGRRVLPVELD